MTPGPPCLHPFLRDTGWVQAADHRTASCFTLAVRTLVLIVYRQHNTISSHVTLQWYTKTCMTKPVTRSKWFLNHMSIINNLKSWSSCQVIFKPKTWTFVGQACEVLFPRSRRFSNSRPVPPGQACEVNPDTSGQSNFQFQTLSPGRHIPPSTTNFVMCMRVWGTTYIAQCSVWVRPLW